MSAQRWVYVALAAFAIGFVGFWPRLLLIVDEERYVSQAVAFARGELALPDRGIEFPPVRHRAISNYPPGTALLQTPFVFAAGWRAAALASVLSLVLATLATARWLRAEGRDERFALLVPGFLPASFFGRIAMSDVPAAALVALTGWLLWRADGRHRGRSALAGIAAGSVVLFREPVLLLVVPLLAGAVLRRAVAPGLLLAGAAAPVALRLAMNAWLFGSPWYLRDPGIRFSLDSLAHTTPVYALVLLVVLPGAALLPFAYRGPRRPELVVGISAYVVLFLLYDYDAVALNGPAKGIMLAARFMIPAAPLFALLAAEVWPRWSARVVRRRPPALRLLTGAACLAAVAVAFAVHPLAARQEAAVLPIQRAIQESTRPGVPVITNTDATLKYFSPAYGARRLLRLEALPPDSLGAFSRRFGVIDVVVLDRTDSRVFDAAARKHAEFLRAVDGRCHAAGRVDRVMPDGSRLRVLEVRACR